jgi:hypothetical protein
LRKSATGIEQFPEISAETQAQLQQFEYLNKAFEKVEEPRAEIEIQGLMKQHMPARAFL